MKWDRNLRKNYQEQSTEVWKNAKHKEVAKKENKIESSNKYHIWILQREKNNGGEALLKDIMFENFPDLYKNTMPQI